MTSEQEINRKIRELVKAFSDLLSEERRIKELDNNG